MAVQVSYPGVYIDEFEPAPPITGVSTSTAAFVGVAASGPLRTPTMITGWDTFQSTFGSQPVPGFYLYYAVRGYFNNGGQQCYIVRASNGLYGTLPIADRNGNTLFTVSAAEPGPTPISITLTPQNVLSSATTSLFQPTGALTVAANINDRQLTLSAAAAAQFRPGDIVTLNPPGPPAENLQILRVSSTATGGVLSLASPLANAYAVAATVALANTPAGATVFRLVSTVPIAAGTLVPGSMLTFAQGANTDTEIVIAVQTEQLPGSPTPTTYRVTLRNGLDFPVNMSAAATVQSEEFSLAVWQGASSQVYAGLALDDTHPRNYLAIINGDSNAVIGVTAQEPPPPDAMPNNMPAAIAVQTPLAGGTAENLATLADADYINALDTLHGVADANMIAAPGVTSAAVQQAMIAMCELLADRFAVLDAAPGLDPVQPTGVLQQRAGLDSTRGYAALYYPWLRVTPANSGNPVLVPPSGHACGMIALTDISRGVFKAPANIIVNDALAAERVLSDIEHGIVNLAGIDAFRVFSNGARPTLYGARTTATDTNWTYINIRRLFIYLEQSIKRGIQWAVFEPNNTTLWAQLTRSISDFLHQRWREGALFGDKASDAYYVRIDEALNPFSEQQLGRLHVEIGVRPSYPAEFIIVRIGIWAGGSDVSES